MVSLEFFYKNCWNVIAHDLLAVIRRFFKTGWVPPSVNSSIISFIPKKDNPMCLSDFIPVSLCNFILKISARILAKRIGHLLPKSFCFNKVSLLKGEKLVIILN